MFKFIISCKSIIECDFFSKKSVLGFHFRLILSNLNSNFSNLFSHVITPISDSLERMQSIHVLIDIGAHLICELNQSKVLPIWKLHESDHLVKTGLHTLVIIRVEAKLAITIDNLFSLIFARVKDDHVTVPEGTTVAATNHDIFIVHGASNRRIPRAQNVQRYVKQLPFLKIVSLVTCILKTLN